MNRPSSLPTRILLCRRLGAGALGLASMMAFASAQQGAPPGLVREQMWFAPTAEDWQRPCLVAWQRTWDDAKALAHATSKPILVCVNMDGEIASEHYAGVRYRQPEIARLYEPYVCVIASVYRHTPRDFDEQGRRIPCPRFGTVTCGEHIAIEPILFAKFMDGKRIAPRHIMVELDGKQTYDVFYAWDTDSVFQAIRDGIEQRAIKPVPVVRGDRSLLERVASKDNADRTAVEDAYAKGDAALRRSLVEAAVAQGGDAPVDLLRLAVFGFDRELSQRARTALAKSNADGAVDLINEALAVPMPAGEHDALVAALQRLGDQSPRARTLAVVHQGLAGRSTAVDVDQWAAAMGSGSYAPASDPQAIAARIDQRIDQGMAAARTRPQDAAARLELAEALLAEAVDPRTAPPDPRTAAKFERLRFEDAFHAATEAEQLGANGWRVDAALALAAARLGKYDEAYGRAEKAVGGLPAEANGWSAMAVLALFAEARQEAIRKAVIHKQPWPQQWLTDVHAAYSVLARHPLATDAYVLHHYDFLKFFGAAAPAEHALTEGLARFPDSPALHERLRARILAEQGAPGLEPAYAAMLAKADAPPSFEWFAGYASLVAAEFQRRSRDRAGALAAYDRAIGHYEQYCTKNPDHRDSADHYVAMAMAGRARLQLEGGDLEHALAEITAAFTRKPSAAASLDGLNISAVDTAKMLLSRLQQQRADLAARLQGELDKLDPELLQLPAYERDPAGISPPRRRRGQ